MKEKFFKDLGLDDDNGKMKKLENQYNLDDLFEKKEEKKDDKKEKVENKSEKKISEEN
ncbi:MAG TPA: hypothetical protein OIM42_07235 [Clostridiaceae bacterium]|jgi:hypothetical protein|nr:unknown [Clostridium sp. CAG:571]HJJ14614.1 hypothetical protein [Clostridiaceae bacterium]